MASDLDYTGMLVSQRALPQTTSDGELFVLAARASDVLEWSRVDRTIETIGAAQRVLSKTHHQRIRAFVEASPKNVIPTAVTIALPPGSFTIASSSKDQVRAGKLTVRRAHDDTPGVIIDGQHRLHGLAQVDIPVLVTVLLGADKLERALQFVVINNTARRVPTDLVKGILAELSGPDQDVFEARLSRSGLTLGRFHNALRYVDEWTESPFKAMLDWDINRDGDRIIKPAAIEKSLRVILSRLDTQDPIELDQAVELLVAMWTGIRDAWAGSEAEWRTSKILAKAGLVSCVEFVVEKLNHEAEEGELIGEAEVVMRIANEVFDNVPHTFWLASWDEKGLDTDAGHRLIRMAIRQVRKAVSRGVADPLGEVRALSLRTS